MSFGLVAKVDLMGFQTHFSQKSEAWVNLVERKNEATISYEACLGETTIKENKGILYASPLYTAICHKLNRNQL